MKLIYLEWEDAASSSSWKFKSDIDKWANSPSNNIHQVGFVLKETKKYLVLCGRWSPPEKILVTKKPMDYCRKYLKHG